MTLFLPNIPQPNDNLDFSQGQLLANNQGLDTVFGIDHYKFSDATANKGFHNKVTTPNFVTSPPTLPNAPPATSAAPIFYGFKQLDGAGNPTNQLPVLQYSISTTNAVASPVTFLQSQAAPISLTVGASTNILDFAGIVRAYGTLIYVFRDSSNHIASIPIYWTGSSFINANNNGSLDPIASGSVLTLKNDSGTNKTNVFWTFEFARIDSI